MFALIACAALLAADSPPAPTTDAPDAEARVEYEARRQATGRAPDDQVRLAYWCEAHGLPAERLRHLALAVLADPDHAAARALMGLVSRDRRWLKPEAVADRVKADPALAATLAEYDAKRLATPYTADGQWGLANWADGHGLPEQARAHLTAVVRLDPRRDAAWKRLGYRKVDGRWATDAEVATAKADAEAQKLADKKWRPLLERWRGQLDRPSQRAEAEANLLAVTDPRALPSIGPVFLGGSAANARVALQLFTQIDSAAASRAIARLAFADDPTTRRLARESLRRRDPRDFAAGLIALLRERVEYEIQGVDGPGSTGRLLIKQPKQKVQRLYATPSVPPYLSWLAQQSGGAPTLSYGYDGVEIVRQQAIWTQHYSYDNFIHLNPGAGPMGDAIRQKQQEAPEMLRHFIQGGPHNRMAYNANPASYKANVFGVNLSEVQDMGTPFRTQTEFPLAAMIAEYQKTAAVAQQQIARDAALIDAYNRQVDATNEGLTQVLRSVSGQDHGIDRVDWTRWLVDVSGYSMTTDPSSDTPTFTINVPLAYQPQAVPIGQTTFATGPTVVADRHLEMSPTSTIMSCFAAGTPVQTIAGPRPIEGLKVGDLVLTQSTATGALGYHPVLVTHHNPPAATYRINVAGDAIMSSQFHRFWVARRGWVMARDLKAGDPIRTLGGVVPIDAVAAGKVEPVFNLDIADDADFFAGASAALVHDNTLPDPRLVPFDRPADAPKAVAAR